MKKLFYSLAVMSVISFAGSCQQDLDPVMDGDTTVTFTVSAGDLMSKADPSPIANGENIDVLYWEIYNTGDIRTASGPLGENKIVDNDGDKEFEVTLKLIADQKYTIIFWAQVDGKNHYVTDDLRDIAINTYADEQANDESRAAFFRVYEFETENGKTINEDIYLHRPFAQINLGSDNYETTLNQVNGGKVQVKSSEMTITHIANRFNTLDGVGERDDSFGGVVTFKAAATPNGERDQKEKLLYVNDADYYYWIGMNYLIVDGVNSSDNVKVDITLETNMGTVRHTVDNVPVKENYRTNILGDFLTTGATFNVIVDEKFMGQYAGPDFEELPVYDETTSTWTVTTTAQLESVAVVTADSYHLVIEAGETYLLKGLELSRTLKVSGEGTLILEGTKITVTSENDAVKIINVSVKSTSDEVSASDVKIEIVGEVSLEGGKNGISIDNDARLTITGDILNVLGKNGSGIGGGADITIEDLKHLTSEGNGKHAFGIGADNAIVNIKNTTIDYVCGGFIQPLLAEDDTWGKKAPEGGPAIGGAKVVIEESTVIKAEGGSKAAAIGAKFWNSTDITILNSQLYDIFGGNASAGIGGSRYNKANKQSIRIKIENSVINNAVGGDYGSGIGSGYDTYCATNDENAVNDIVITKSTITAKGGKYAAGIGTGHHSAALTGCIDSESIIVANAGDEKLCDESGYGRKNTNAQNIGYGCVDLNAEFKGSTVTFTIDNQVIDAPVAYDSDEQ